MLRLSNSKAEGSLNSDIAEINDFEMSEEDGEDQTNIRSKKGYYK